jgi:MFS family permease
MLFAAGLFQTIEGPAYDALNADYSTTAQREKAYSLSYLGFNLGFIIGASASGLLFEKFVRLAFCLNGLAVFTSTVLIFFFVHTKNAISEDAQALQTSYSEYEQPVADDLSVMKVLKTRSVVLGMLLVGCVASMPQYLVGILLPLQLKQSMGEAGATIYGYLNSLNGFVVIVFTPILTIVLKKITEIPKVILGMLLFVGGIALFSVETAVAVLFVGMFVFTLGEVITVLGSNPYLSRRVPASHRGRVGGVSSVLHSVFSSATQYLISFMLIWTGSNYKLLWLIFGACGLAAAVLYGFLYAPDRRTFPKLYK